MSIVWDLTYALPSTGNLPSLPTTRRRKVAKSPSKLQKLVLILRDDNPHHVQLGTDPISLISLHMSQLLSVVVPPGLEKLDLMINFVPSNISVARGFSVFVDTLRGMTWEGLNRLGIIYPHSVDSQQQISDSWVSLRHLDIVCRSSGPCSSPCWKVSSRSRPTSRQLSRTLKYVSPALQHSTAPETVLQALLDSCRPDTKSFHFFNDLGTQTSTFNHSPLGSRLIPSGHRL
jgi:hypothetical protein